MSLSPTMLAIIIGGCIVTLLPRILPFIIVKNITLPKVVLTWLSYIPICILSAIIAEQLWIEDKAAFGGLSFDYRYFIAIIPTVIIAIWTKSLGWTVVIGILSMALLRYLI